MTILGVMVITMAFAGVVTTVIDNLLTRNLRFVVRTGIAVIKLQFFALMVSAQLYVLTKHSKSHRRLS